MRAAWLSFVLVPGVAFAQGDVPLIDGLIHLGDTVIETWTESTPEPVGRSLTHRFEASANASEFCLVFSCRDAHNEWDVKLNDVVVATIAPHQPLKEYIHVVLAGTLRTGPNELTVAPRGQHDDDILFGRARLVARSLRDHLDLRVVEVEVRDDDGTAIPARVTVTDAKGELVDIYYAATERTAVRKGVLYVADGVGRFEVSGGRCVVWASRGMEWSVDSKERDPQSTEPVELSITREVDTTGYVAADTHIHTLQFSGHGDASLQERLVTLAGEGVELAVATDHNHNIDYAPTQREMRLGEYYTSVVGNEVTTSNGHFNAFPLDPNDPVPNHDLTDWVALIEGIRARGARVVILNHPRWPQIHTGPFGKQHFHLNRMSGAFANGPAAVTWDAMELVNSTTQARDPLYNFVDWFALLNHGERVMAVGTSDSHTVGDPVGQGRTYLASSTDDPARIDVDEACDGFRNGRGSIAQGIFVECWIEDGYRMGEIAPLDGTALDVALRIATPSWVRARKALVYINGKLAEERSLDLESGVALDRIERFELARPTHDVHVVCVVLGDGVRERFWRSDATNDYTLGATNPVFVDVDGDGHYSDPRAQASVLVDRAGLQQDRLVRELERVDDAVAVQALGIVHAKFGADVDAAHALLDTIAARLNRADVTKFVELIRH